LLNPKGEHPKRDDEKGWPIIFEPPLSEPYSGYGYDIARAALTGDQGE
jgi:hypothetical protein